MRKYKLILIWLIFIINTVSAQSYFAVGYSAGKFTTGLPNMRNTIYHFNTIDYKDFDNKFTFINLPHGITWEWGIKGKKAYYFIKWSNLHIKSIGSGPNPANTSENLELKIKVRLNQLSPFNFGLLITDNIGVAFSPVDLADFKVLYKSNVDLNGNSKANKWNDFYDVNKGLLSSYFTAGSTFYLDVDASKSLHFRLAYYIDWFGEDLGVLPSYRYRANNINLSMLFRINRKK